MTLNEDERAVLKSFFAAHYYPYWDEGGLTHEELVNEYVSGVEPERVVGLRAAVLRLAEYPASTEELDLMLYEDFGSYFLPGDNDLDTRHWLLWLAEQLVSTR